MFSRLQSYNIFIIYHSKRRICILYENSISLQPGTCPFSTLKNRRYSMGRILLAGFLGAIVLMIWGFLSWAVLPWSGQSMLKLPNEDTVLSALKAGNAESGMYVI